MTQTKIEGKFYPLKNDEWLAIAKKLTHSELLVLYHLRTLEPFGDKLTESSTKDVAEATGISQRSVQRALIKLADLELIDLHIQKFEFKLRSQHTTETTGSDSAVASTSPVSPTRQACREVVTAVANSSPVSRSQAETITTPEFQNSKTYSDLIKDLNRSLSEGNARERTFLEFKEGLSKEEFQAFWDYAMYVATSFRETLKTNAIRLPEAWIKKYHQELYQQFLDELEHKYGSRNFEEILARSKNSDNSPSVKKQEVDW